jgi:multiple sugar transport system permease protein
MDKNPSTSVTAVDDDKYRIKKPLVKSKLAGDILLYLPVLFWSVVVIFPFWYMIVLATKTNADIFNFPPPLSFDKDFFNNVVTNWNVLFNKVQFWRNLWNSVYIAVMSTALTLFVCSLTGYTFAVYEFKGKEIIFTMLLFTMMIPSMVTLIPYFSMMQTFGWIDQARALYLPGAASAYGVFLIRQYVESSMPKDVLEAARIDGCTEFGIYWRIVIPLITPILGSLGIITFIGSWNNYMQALVVMTNENSYTIPVALSRLQGQQTIDYGAIFVGTAISVIPLIIVFIFMSSMIIDRVMEGSVKS